MADFAGILPWVESSGKTSASTATRYDNRVGGTASDYFNKSTSRSSGRMGSFNTAIDRRSGSRTIPQQTSHTSWVESFREPISKDPYSDLRTQYNRLGGYSSLGVSFQDFVYGKDRYDLQREQKNLTAADLANKNNDLRYTMEKAKWDEYMSPENVAARDAEKRYMAENLALYNTRRKKYQAMGAEGPYLDKILEGY